MPRTSKPKLSEESIKHWRRVDTLVKETGKSRLEIIIEAVRRLFSETHPEQPAKPEE